MGSTIKAIQTTYNGIRFRSRTEARWAVFMDAIGIPYVYEPEGFVFGDGTTYLPDFWLPNQDTFLECKGVMSDKDLHKIEMLVVESGKEVVVAYPEMKFDVFDISYLVAGTSYQSKMPWLLKCKHCGKKYFANGDHNINLCRCCGCSWEKDPFTLPIYIPYGRFGKESPDVSNALMKAKSARFEHGEDGTNG